MILTVVEFVLLASTALFIFGLKPLVDGSGQFLSSGQGRVHVTRKRCNVSSICSPSLVYLVQMGTTDEKLHHAALLLDLPKVPVACVVLDDPQVH